MTNIFALLFFVLTQLTVEQQLAEKYCPSKTNLKKTCPSCGSLLNRPLFVSLIIRLAKGFTSIAITSPTLIFPIFLTQLSKQF